MIWLSLLVTLTEGCKKSTSETPTNQTSETPKPQNTETPVVARLHWLGKKRIAADTNSAYLMTIWTLPETGKLEAQTLDKLATAPWRLLLHQPSTNAQSPMAASPLLRPLLDDLVQEESYLEIRAATNQPGQFAFAIRLNDERAKLWETNLGAVFESLTGLKVVGRRPEAGGKGSGWMLTKHEAPNFIELSRAGDWTLVGLAQAENPLLKEFASRIDRDHAPFSPRATNFWIEADLDPRSTAHAFAHGWDLPEDLPHVVMTIIGDGEHVRTRAQMDFPKPLPLELEPWTVPTNIVHDPLISFTAIQGIRPWLASLQAWRDSSLGEPPNQIYFWGLDGGPLQTYFAAALKNPAESIPKVEDFILRKINPLLDNKNVGAFERSPANNRMVWTGFPLISPFLDASDTSSGAFLTGGLAYYGRTNAAPPPNELIQQVITSTNLLCYDWEVTEPRIRDWLYYSQFLRILFKKAQLPPPSAFIRWQLAVISKLGNCTTLLTLTGPRELAFSRQSSAGFSSPEIHLIGDWLESPDFPLGLYTLRATDAPSHRAGTMPGSNSVSTTNTGLATNDLPNANRPTNSLTSPFPPPPSPSKKAD